MEKEKVDSKELFRKKFFHFFFFEKKLKLPIRLGMSSSSSLFWIAYKCKTFYNDDDLSICQHSLHHLSICFLFLLLISGKKNIFIFFSYSKYKLYQFITFFSIIIIHLASFDQTKNKFINDFRKNHTRKKIW